MLTASHDKGCASSQALSMACKRQVPSTFAVPAASQGKARGRATSDGAPAPAATGRGDSAAQTASQGTKRARQPAAALTESTARAADQPEVGQQLQPALIKGSISACLWQALPVSPGEPAHLASERCSLASWPAEQRGPQPLLSPAAAHLAACCYWHHLQSAKRVPRTVSTDHLEVPC